MARDLACLQLLEHRRAAGEHVAVGGIEVAGVPGIGHVAGALGPIEQARNLAVGVVAKDATQATRVLSIHIDNVIPVAILRATHLTGTVRNDGNPDFTQLGNRAMMRRVADLLGRGRSGVNDKLACAPGALHQLGKHRLSHRRAADVPMAERPEIDRWILSVLNTLVKDVDNCYNEYEPTKAGRLISDFVNDNLSNWYVRLNRKRFWGGGMTQDKLSAFQTLYTCLETVAKLMAPIAPFYADMLYSDLTAATGRDNVVSVHLAKFPECKEEIIDKELEARMQMAQDVTSMVLALRRKVNIKVRQPLQCIMVPVVDEEQRAHIEAVKALIMNEVNVKEIQFVDGAAGVLVKKVKCDFKKLGPKFGKQMKAVAAAVAGMSQEAIAELEKNGAYTLNLDGAEAVIETSDVEIFSEDIPGWLVANEGKLTVALEVTITEELRREGIARELVNRIQNIRKSSGFEITDKIKITLSKNPQTDDAVNEYKDYICNQVLGTSLTLTDGVESGTELEFDDFKLYVSVVKE